MRLIFPLIILFTISIFLFLPQLQKNSQLEKEQVQPENSKPQVKGAETKSNQPERIIYLGLWTQGFFDPGENTLHPAALKNMENKIGKKAAIAHYFRGWEVLDSPRLLEELNVINENGWRPMLSVNPYFFEKCPKHDKPLYRAIAEGDCDQFLKDSAQSLRSFSKPLFLRFAWEMNASTMEWQIQKTGSSNSDFTGAWQRMHNIFYAQNATNVLWVFSPDVSNNSYEQFYPGDAYVDWVALDGYNWGMTQSWSKWQTFSDIFSQAYQKITQLAPNKPLMVAEVGTTDKGGDKVFWYQDMLDTQVPKNFLKIKAVVFYNEDRTVKENVNWLIDITDASLNSFSKAVVNPIYHSSF